MPSYDPEFLAALQSLMAGRQPPPPKPAIHDVATRRKNIDAGLGILLSQVPRPKDVTETIYTTPASDGHILNIHHFQKSGTNTNTTTDTQSNPSPAIYYIHGGGYIAMQVRTSSNSIATTCSTSGLQIFAIEYRLAPENPFPTPLEDCYTGLHWLLSQPQLQKFNIDPHRIGIMGESAGGGLAAAVCIAARDRNISPPIKKQILIYPMLDNTNVIPNPDIEDMTVWTIEDNITGWAAYLGLHESKGNPADVVDPPVLAVPARVESVKGLPPMYIEVGTLDNFRDEDVKYAVRFMQEGVNAELHLWDGLPHAFNTLARETECARRAVRMRIAAILSL